MDLYWSGCMSVCPRVENRDQLVKTFRWSTYMTILWWCLVILYFLSVFVYIDRVITPHTCIFTLGCYRELYSARWDLSFEVLYDYVHEKKWQANFRPSKCIGCGRCTLNNFLFFGFHASVLLRHLLTSLRRIFWYINFGYLEEKKIFRVLGTPAEEKIDFELFLINQGNVVRVHL